MPHFELDDRISKGRRQRGSPQPQATSGLASLASMSNNDFGELVWENGQIAIRGPKDWDCSHTKKAAKYESVESLKNSILADYSFKHDNNNTHSSYYQNDRHKSSDLQGANGARLMAESFEANTNAQLSDYTDATTINTNTCHTKRWKTFKSVGSEHQLLERTSSELWQSSLQPCQASVPYVRSHGLDSILSSNTNSTNLPITNFDSMGGSLGLKKQKLQDPGTNKKIGLMNLSQFSKPFALVEASIQSLGATRHTNITDLSRIEELNINNKKSGANTSNTAESTPGEPGATVPELILPKAMPQKEPFPDEYSKAVCQEDVSKRKESPDHVLGQASNLSAASAAQGKPKTEKFIEPMVASSSVCSHGASNDPTCYLKRKYQGNEESAYLSDDSEDDHKGFIKAVSARGNTGAKRNRTARVHNLYERRRRDKINKKMRALRELIPNCNKVDKASMLDEAIEYLKTLQLQAQIMSMAYMPQMMLPAEMQQIYAPNIPHFSTVGAGMGMSMDMGVGCNQLKFPSSQSGATCLPGIPGTRFQMLGLPGQGLPMSLSSAHFNPLPGGHSAQSVMLGNTSGFSSMVENSTTDLTSSSKNSIQNIKFKNNC